MNDREMQRLADTVGKIQKCICSLQSILDGNNTILQGVATETTLQSVLASLQNGREFEQNIVTDANDDTFFQVRIFDTDSGTFSAPTYFNVDGTVGSPVAPITIVNPQFVLNNILLQLQSSRALTSTFIKDDNGDYYYKVLKYDPVANTYNFDYFNNQGLPASPILPETFDTQQLQTEYLESLFNLDKYQGQPTGSTLRVEISTKTRTPGLQRVTTSGTLAASSYSQVSVMNTGNADGTLLGVILKPGEVVNYQLDRDTAFTAIAYDATGTEFLISTINWVTP